MRADLAALDRGLATQLQRSAEKVRAAIDKLAQKAERVHANSSGRGQRHVRRLQSALMPRGAPQERVRGAVEFTARFGRDWIDRLIEELDPLPTEHLVINLS